MAITALPTPPSRNDPTNFSTRADAFLGALPAFGTEANALAVDVNADAVTASDAATTATTQAGIATTQAGIATTQAGIATTKAGEASASALAADASAQAAAALAASFAGTSTTSVSIGIGEKTFTTQSGEQYTSGIWVTIVSQANAANYMFGQVVSYSGSTLVVNVQSTGGSGTHADWNISLAGVRGAPGTGITDQAVGWTASGGTVSKTLTVDESKTTSQLQDILVSGTNIKTINGGSLLGSGDLAVQPTLVSGTNIKTVGGTSLLGSGDVNVASGVQQFTASGAITAGTGVIINSNGTVSVPTLTISTTAGATATLASDTGAIDSALVYHTALGVYVAVWVQNSTSFLVGSVGVPASDGSVTWSTQQVLYNSNTVSGVAAVYYPTETKVLVTFIIGTTSLAGVVLTATSSSLSASSATSSGSGTSTSQGDLAYDETAGKAVCAYRQSSNGHIFLRTVTVSGTSITWGAAASLGDGNEPNIYYFPPAGKCIVFARYTSNYLYGFLITVSGTAASWGTAQLLSTAEPGQRMGFAYSPIAGKAVISYRDIPGYVDVLTSVLSISGTTLSLGALTKITSGDQGNFTAMTYDSYTDKVVVFYMLDSSNFLATRTGTISGTAISWGSETTLFSGSVSTNSFTAAYDPVNARSGVIWASGTTQSARTVSTGASTLTPTNFLGVSQSTVANGASATITVISGVNSNQSGLTPATKYYVGGNGALTSTANSILAGLALSATSILVKG